MLSIGRSLGVRCDGMVLELSRNSSQRGSNDFLDRLPLLSHFQCARLKASHIQEIRHQPIEPFGFVQDGSGQFLPHLGGERLVVFQQVLLAPVMTESGVRRSCDTASSKELRNRSVSMSSRI